MALFPNPIDVIKDSNLAKDRMESFQQRLNQATQGIPDMKNLGIDSLDDVRRKWEPGFQAGQGRTPAAAAMQPPSSQGATPQGRAVRVNGRIVGYTTDGKTMTPVGQQ